MNKRIIKKKRNSSKQHQPKQFMLNVLKELSFAFGRANVEYFHNDKDRYSNEARRRLSTDVSDTKGLIERLFFFHQIGR